MESNFNIHQDINQAFTLPSFFYRDAHLFEKSKENIFACTWQYVADSDDCALPQAVLPVLLLENVLDEPLLFTRDRVGEMHCLSNVCTHRGKILVEQKGSKAVLSCGYHGRCFRLDGTFKSMPQFEKVLDFPSKKDDLAAIPFANWANLLFASLQPIAPFADFFKPIMERLSWLPLQDLSFDADSSRDFFVQSHWALYCDNYLEGFHIPFVHPALNDAIEFEKYEYEIFQYCNLQIGIAKENEPCFEIPEGAQDYGKRIYAYYFWVFPNLMLNFYPWGLSLNVVQPLAHNKTKVVFRSYYFPEKKGARAANRIDETEFEDEAVVESVQLGVHSRFYERGRFSPTMEQGVHHFHRLVSAFMK